MPSQKQYAKNRMQGPNLTFFAGDKKAFSESSGAQCRVRGDLGERIETLSFLYQ